ncbi:hypothetical protein [Streptomyces sp. NPDC047108]|uniref:hypothetical protein n=1 Tax=Streptomyces sp. NPDC047108 TaxID=3155025 RepID=UPI0033D2A7C7
MRIRHSRAARIATAATAAGILALSTAACEVGGTFSAEPRPSKGSDKGGGESDKERGGTSDDGRANGDATDTRAGTPGDSGTGNDPSGSGKRPCRKSDVSASAEERTQAGGFVMISVKARPGVTCVLPAELPSVSFDSGAHARPAEQTVGRPITLNSTVTAYAGLNPKTGRGDAGRSFNGFDLSLDKDTLFLRIPGGLTVDDPVVSNWNNAEYAAVPGDGTS